VVNGHVPNCIFRGNLYVKISSANQGADCTKYNNISSARNSGECNLIGSACDRMPNMPGIRLEIGKMKLAAEQNTQKHFLIAIFRSGHQIY
jgi:hypothetical protein